MNLLYSAMMRVLRRLTPLCIDPSCWTNTGTFVGIYNTVLQYILYMYMSCVHTTKGSPFFLYYCIHFSINVYLCILIRKGCNLASFLCVVLCFNGV